MYHHFTKKKNLVQIGRFRLVNGILPNGCHQEIDLSLLAIKPQVKLFVRLLAEDRIVTRVWQT